MQPAVHSGLMPATLTTLPHFSVSSAMSLPKSAGEPASPAAQLGQPRLHLGIGEANVDLPVEFVDDLGRRVSGRADAIPSACLVARHELAHGRDVRQRLRAHRRGHCQARSLPALICSMDEAWAKHTCTCPLKQIGSAATASIRHVDHVDAGHHLEQLAGQMARAPAAAEAKSDLAGIGLGVGNEFGNRLGRE